MSERKEVTGEPEATPQPTTPEGWAKAFYEALGKSGTRAPVLFQLEEFAQKVWKAAIKSVAPTECPHCGWPVDEEGNHVPDCGYRAPKEVK